MTERECGEGGRCDGRVLTDVVIDALMRDEEDGTKVMEWVPREMWPDADGGLWPTACGRCGTAIGPDDVTIRQVNQALEYRRVDTGEMLYPLFRGSDEAYAGAMSEAWWWFTDDVGPDGMRLRVILPDGMPWDVDREATNGGRWTRTGDPKDPPSLSVSPSIKTPGYHGYLTSGVLTDDVG